MSYGILNLTHRDGHDAPEYLVPGERYAVRLQLNDIAHGFEPGHTIRIALSTTYWPMIWPPPHPVRLTITTGKSNLELPVRQPRPEDAALRPFEPPERAPKPDTTTLRPTRSTRFVTRDLTTLKTIYEVFGDGGDFGGASLARIEDIDLVVGHTFKRNYVIREYDVEGAEVVMEQHTVHRRGTWETRLEVKLRLSADAHAFRIEASLVAFEGADELVRRQWDERIPRRLL
jgi:hypothetical protein